MKLVSSLLTLVFLAVLNAAQSAPLVESPAGQIEGEDLNGVEVFRGIPYAQTVTDELRFAPPVAVQPFSKKFTASRFCPIAPQSGFLNYDSTQSGGANYLCLNIFRPKGINSDSSVPVYVWIHGGAFAAGSGSIPLYDGSHFAKDGIITVTLNYRLGAEGFLYSQKLLTKYGTSGNWGLMDIIEALKWINKNIGSFGGDISNITVGGNSAGAMAASALILNPQLKGLFQKAVLESGTLISYPFLGFNTEQNHEIAVSRSQKLFSEFGVDDSDTGIDMLRSLDPFLLAYHCAYDYNFANNRGSFMVPYFDGNIIPKSPYHELKKGNYNDVTVLMGYNTDEGTLFVNPDISENDLISGFYANFDKNTAESLKNLYKITEKSSSFAKTSEFLGDVMFNLGMKIFADNLSKTQKVYVYHFDYLPKSSNKDGSGVHHSSELKYAFLNLPQDASDKTRDVAQVFHMRLLNFLKTGDPNSDGSKNTLIKWKTYDTTDSAVLRIGSYTGVEEFKLKDKLLKLEEIFFGSQKN